MVATLWVVLIYPFSFFQWWHDPALEVLALRHQLMVLKRQTRRPGPIARPVESLDRGKVVEMPWVGGLHHQYLRQAA